MDEACPTPEQLDDLRRNAQQQQICIEYLRSIGWKVEFLDGVLVRITAPDGRVAEFKRIQVAARSAAA
jgi:hypothetical protein